MKFGVAGVHYGHFGMMVQDALRRDDIEMVGVAEPDEALRTQWCEKCECEGFERVEDMIERAGPDAVIEGVSIHEKADLVRLCAASKTHLLLDKPLGLSLDELVAMAEQVRASGIELSMYFTLRYWPPFFGLKTLAAEGKLGRIVTMISTHPHKLGIERRPPWMFERATYPGALCDFVCHGMDFCRWLTGAEPVRVFATHGNAKYPEKTQFQDHARTFFELDDGSVAIITGDWLWPDEAPSFGESRVIVTGTKGTATLRSWTKSELEVALTGEGAQEVEMPKIELRAFIDGFVEAVESGEKPPVSNRDVFQTAQAALLAREAADSGGVVKDIPRMWP